MGWQFNYSVSVENIKLTVQLLSLVSDIRKVAMPNPIAAQIAITNS
jgi:hypothetical protein